LSEESKVVYQSNDGKEEKDFDALDSGRIRAEVQDAKEQNNFDEVNRKGDGTQITAAYFHTTIQEEISRPVGRTCMRTD
jgi:hypothetical protein